MKDPVDSGHLTRYYALRVNRDKVMDLVTWFKMIQTSLMLRQCSPKP